MSAGELTVELDLDNPYPGPATFREDQGAFFFGRDGEKRTLRDLVRRERTVVLFGKSGTGKSSLLRAGVFGPLREAGHVPILVRFSFVSQAPSPAHQIRSSIRKAIADQGIEADPPSDDVTLWEYFHRTPFWGKKSALLTPVLVFDQFEEVFTLGRHFPGLHEALDELADVIENRVPKALADPAQEDSLPPGWRRPKVRVLLAIREDYLPQLEDLSSLIPSLIHNRYHLAEMSGTNAVQAVLLGGKAIHVEPERAREIVLAAAGRAPPPVEKGAKVPAAEPPPDLDAIEVHPALLSVFCWELNEGRKALRADQISPAQVRLSEDLFIDFYKRSLVGLPRKVADFIEEGLVDAGGRRTSMSIEDARTALGESAQDLRVDEQILRPLVERRILSLEPRYGTVHVELVHDKLSKVVKEAARRRRDKQARYAVFGVTLALSILGVGGLVGGGVWMAGRGAGPGPDLMPTRPIEIARDKAEAEKKDSLARESRQLLAAAHAEQDPADAAILLARIARQADENGWQAPPDLRSAMAQEVARRPGSRDLHGHTGEVQSIAVSPDGREVVSGASDRTVRRWIVDREAPGRSLSPAFEDAVTAVRYSSDGDLLAAGAADGNVAVWERRRAVGAMVAWRSSASSPGAGGLEQPVWRGVLPAGAAGTKSLRVVDLAFSGGEDRRLIVLLDRGVLRVACRRDAGCPEGPRPLSAADQARWVGGALSDDGRWLAQAFSGGVLRWWDLTNGRVAGCVTLSQPSREVGLVGSVPAVAPAPAAAVCSPSGGPGEAPVTALAFAGDRLFAARDRHVFVVRLTERPPSPTLLTPSLETGEVTTLAASPSEGVVAAASTGALRRWSSACLDDKTTLETPPDRGECSVAWSWSDASVTSLALAPTRAPGQPLPRVLGAAGSQLRLWTFDRPAPSSDWAPLEKAIADLTNACLSPRARQRVLGLREAEALSEYNKCESEQPRPSAGAATSKAPVQPPAPPAPPATAVQAPSTGNESAPPPSPPLTAGRPAPTEVPLPLGAAGGAGSAPQEAAPPLPPAAAVDRAAIKPLASAKKLPGALPTGEPFYQFTLSLSVPPDLAKRVTKVTWEMNHPSFKQQRMTGAGASHRITWLGWGCLRTVTARVELGDAAPITVKFDMCKALGW